MLDLLELGIVRWVYRCGAAVRVIEGRRSVDAQVAGRAATLRHRKASMLNN